MPTSEIPRLYHSTVTLTPQGNFLIAGSNPNPNTTLPAPGIEFPTEFRVETLDPPFMKVERPVLGALPAHIPFGQTMTAKVTIPRGLSVDNVKCKLVITKQRFKANIYQSVSLMDLGFSSHSFHSSARLVFMNATLSKNRNTITFTTPPSGRVYPPGPATLFLTVDNVTSVGVQTIVGSGASPPILE
jgi:hypothetical protein